jgi:hypothetical protein
MTAKNFINSLAVRPRRKVVATALVYGLSLAVRFTSAAGEEVEIPAPSVQRTKPVMSIMTGASPRLPYEDWASNAAQPIVFRPGCPLGSAGRIGM